MMDRCCTAYYLHNSVENESKEQLIEFAKMQTRICITEDMYETDDDESTAATCPFIDSDAQVDDDVKTEDWFHQTQMIIYFINDYLSESEDEEDEISRRRRIDNMHKAYREIEAVADDEVLNFSDADEMGLNYSSLVDEMDYVETREGLSVHELSHVNGLIDQDLFKSNKADGSCVFDSILNGIYYKRFNTVLSMEERFKDMLPQIYGILKPYREMLIYKRLMSVIKYCT